MTRRALTIWITAWMPILLPIAETGEALVRVAGARGGRELRMRQADIRKAAPRPSDDASEIDRTRNAKPIQTHVRQSSVRTSDSEQRPVAEVAIASSEWRGLQWPTLVPGTFYSDASEVPTRTSLLLPLGSRGPPLRA